MMHVCTLKKNFKSEPVLLVDMHMTGVYYEMTAERNRSRSGHFFPSTLDILLSQVSALLLQVPNANCKKVVHVYVHAQYIPCPKQLKLLGEFLQYNSPFLLAVVGFYLLPAGDTAWRIKKNRKT